MKQFKRGIVFFLVIMATVLPWTAAEALETFEKAGKIAEITSSEMTVSGMTCRLRSSTEMVSADPNRQKLSDLAPGDRVFVRGIVLNGVNYISRVVYQIPDPS